MDPQVCKECGCELTEADQHQLCVDCKRAAWLRGLHPSNNSLDRRLEDGFALLNASEDEDIDPNDHI